MVQEDCVAWWCQGKMVGSVSSSAGFLSSADALVLIWSLVLMLAFSANDRHCCVFQP